MVETTQAAEPAHRQYLAIKFKATDRRTYTYHNDGDRCEVGEIIKLRAADGWQRVEVVAVDLEKPSFPTKPIGGKLPPPEFKLQNEGPTNGAD